MHGTLGRRQIRLREVDKYRVARQPLPRRAALGTTPVFVNSDAMDEGSARGMTQAIRSPVSAAS